jgi:hypothetical protein
MEKSESEPMLTFKLSDRDEFRCSAYGVAVASIHNSRFVVSGLADPIAMFREHVGRYHPDEDASRAPARIA